MDDDDTLILALYKWTPGDCFRCARTGIDTTGIAEVPTPIGDRYEMRACRACVLELEAMAREAAANGGREYAPGHVGNCGKN